MILMKNNRIIASWNKIEPDDSANERMLSAILEQNRSVRGRKDKVISMLRNAKTKKRMIPVTACLVVLAAVVGILGNNLHWFRGPDKCAREMNSKIVKTSYMEGDFAINYNDLNQVVGSADYVFVGTVESDEGTVYKNYVTMETENGGTKEVGTPYSNYMVTVIENIKGNLITEKPVPVQKSGGLSEDGTTIYLYEGDELPMVGATYIFFAYAQQDGSLLISGPVSNIDLDVNNDENTEANAIDSYKKLTDYHEILEAYENQVEEERIRFKSSYEAE